MDLKRPPILSPQFDEEHFLRRGNQEVHVKKVRRSLMRVGTRLGARFFLLLILVFGLVGLYHWATHAERFEVRHIVLEGARFADQGDILARLGQLKGYNLFTLNPQELLPGAQQFPWVKQFLFTKKLPDTLMVEVVEKEPRALVQVEDGLLLIGEQGEPIATVKRFPGMDNLPVLADGAHWQRQDRKRALDFLGSMSSEFPGVYKRVNMVARLDQDWEVHLKGGVRLLVAGRDWQEGITRYAWAADVLTEKFGSQALVDTRWQGQLGVRSGSETTASSGYEGDGHGQGQ